MSEAVWRNSGAAGRLTGNGQIVELQTEAGGLSGPAATAGMSPPSVQRIFAPGDARVEPQERSRRALLRQVPPSRDALAMIHSTKRNQSSGGSTAIANRIGATSSGYFETASLGRTSEGISVHVLQSGPGRRELSERRTEPRLGPRAALAIPERVRCDRARV